MREVMEELKSSGAAISDFTVSPSDLASLIKLVADDTVSGQAGREVFKGMASSGETPETVIKRLGLQQISGGGELERFVDEVIAGHPGEAERYRAGEAKLIGFFIGQVMKKSGGKANPKVTGDIVRKKLGG